MTSRTERVFLPGGLPEQPQEGEDDLLEEVAYAPTSEAQGALLKTGDTLVVGAYSCTVIEALSRGFYQRYRVQAVSPTKELLAQLWVGNSQILQTQIEFLGQLNHRMLPERLGWEEQAEMSYLLVSAAQGLNLQQHLGRVGWAEVLGDYLQLVQLLKKINQTGWAVLSFGLSDVIVQRPVVLEELTNLSRLYQVPTLAVYGSGYSAPELVESRPLTGSEDIYTLGAIFYRILTGEDPPEAGLDLLNPPPQALVPGALQVLGRTMAPARERCDFDELLRLVRQLRNILQKTAYTYEVGGATTVGLSLQRVINQDAWGYRVLSKVTEEGSTAQLMACVADGIGGMAQGEVASSLAVGTFLGATDAPSFGENSTEQAEWTIYRVCQANQTVYNQLMGAGGSTFTGVVLSGPRLTLAHIGDSRAYWLRASGVVQISEDHTLTQSLVNSGMLTEEEALHHSERNKIFRSLGELRELPTNYVGTLQDTQGHISIDLAQGDVILLCSDGVWEQIDMVAAYHQIRASSDLQAAANDLIRHVLAVGAPDNATVVLLRCWAAVT